jgi:enediyne biosynthesis protein E4
MREAEAGAGGPLRLDIPSQSDLRLHFGLGSADKIDKVEIKWPYGKSNETVPGFKVDQFVTITEGRNG